MNEISALNAFSSQNKGRYFSCKENKRLKIQFMKENQKEKKNYSWEEKTKQYCTS